MIQQVIQLHALLESCQFQELWEVMREGSTEVTGLVSGFESSVKNCTLMCVCQASLPVFVKSFSCIYTESLFHIVLYCVINLCV